MSEWRNLSENAVKAHQENTLTASVNKITNESQARKDYVGFRRSFYSQSQIRRHNPSSGTLNNNQKMNSNRSASKNLASQRLLTLRASLKNPPVPSQSTNQTKERQRKFENSESLRPGTVKTNSVPGDSSYDSAGCTPKNSNRSKIIYYTTPRIEIPTEKSELKKRPLKRKISRTREDDDDDEERRLKIRCDRTKHEFHKPQQSTSSFVSNNIITPTTTTTPDTLKNKSESRNLSHSAPSRINCTKNLAQDRLQHLRKQIQLSEESKTILFQNKGSYTQSASYPKKESNSVSTNTETANCSKQIQVQNTEISNLGKEYAESNNLSPNVFANVSQEVQGNSLFNKFVIQNSVSVSDWNSTQSSATQVQLNDTPQHHESRSFSYVEKPLNFDTDVMNLHQNNESVSHIQEANNDDIEYMDQDVSEDTEVLPSESSVDANCQNGTNESKISCPTTDTDSPKKAKSKETCIVVDTNIFLDNLETLKEIIDKSNNGKQELIIYVPWMVITELDYLKDSNKSSSDLRIAASNAIAFINACLMSENKRLKGQTIYDMNKQMNIGKSPDDKILCSCIQATQEYETVILLSKDVNLKNKALLNNISVASPSEIQLSLHRLCKVSKNVQKITQKLNLLCSYVICECAKEAYGKVWNRMDLLKSGPWSLKDCIKIFKKYWISVFKEKFLKQFEKALDDLMLLLEQSKNIDDKSKEFEDFVNLSCAICIFIKDIDFAAGMAVKTISEIRNIQHSDS